MRRHLGADGLKIRGAFAQARQSGGAIDFRDDDLCRRGLVAAAFQLIALGQQFGARVKCFLQGARLVGQVGDDAVQILGRIAESGRELIEGRERGVDLFERRVAFFHRSHFAQPDLAQVARERFVLGRNGANDIDVFETSLAIEAKVGQVLTKESETFAEKENRDQGEDDDGDQRVAAEKRLDALLERRLGPPR